MPRYRIYVYAICKNEEQFVDRWVGSMAEADGIFVLDTGSTDGTLLRLSAYPKVTAVSAEVSPWRFDAARNRSLSLVPEDADLCVCTDLDEIFVPGWRAAAEAALATGADRLRYRYTWSFTEEGREGTVFLADKMHARRGFVWRYPCHEALVWTGEGSPRVAVAEGVQLNHFPDKTKSRGGYLPLLELAVRENPDDPRCAHYLGREYLSVGRYAEAEGQLRRHLALPGSVWAPERCASMRYLARCCAETGRPEEQEQWLLRSCAEAPFLRAPWMALARLYNARADWRGVIFAVNKALAVKAPTGYMTDAADFGALPYDLLSLAYDHLGDRRSALTAVDAALSFEPENPRLRQNRAYFMVHRGK